MAITIISPQELAARQERGEACELIDVRTPVEFQELHVAFARNIPLDQLEPKALMSARNGASQQPRRQRAPAARGHAPPALLQRVAGKRRDPGPCFIAAYA